MPESDVLDELKWKATDVPDYSDEEKKYLGGLQQRLERARNMRETPRTEFDGMTYSQYWEANEKGANTYIEPKKNPEDSTFQSGTIRRKIFAFLAELLRFEFFADITAFDQNNIEARSLGNVVEDKITKDREIEGDDEKRFLRFYELLKQGTIDVERVWDEQFIKDKKFKGATFDGKLSGVSWTTKVKRKLSSVKTHILCGLNVYVGNIFEYDLAEQPYIFTVEVMDYNAAQAKYGKWERWPFVSKTLKQFFPGTEKNMASNNWRLLDFQKDKVECIKYQDAKGNEFALILNGVLMTPVGLPLPWGYPDFNIARQILKPINAKFAYGSSIVKELRGNVAMYDDLIRLMHLLVLKNISPARGNLTGRTVSRRVFLPSVITPGLDPAKLPLMDERATQGLGTGEFNFAQMLARTNDDNSVGNIPSGQEPVGDPTATEVMEISKQAKTMLSTIITAATLLEWKLSWLSLFTVLAKAFEPNGSKLDEARQEIVKTYQSFAVQRPIADQGMGYRVTYVTDEDLPSPDEIKKKEGELQEYTGRPYKIVVVQPQEVTASRWVWQITMRTKPKPSDELSKILFNKMVSDAITMFGPDVNLPELEADYAVMWDRDPKKFFRQAPQQVQPPAKPPVANGITLPTETQ